jgi:hypothetical protein
MYIHTGMYNNSQKTCTGLTLGLLYLMPLLTIFQLYRGRNTCIKNRIKTFSVTFLESQYLYCIHTVPKLLHLFVNQTITVTYNRQKSIIFLLKFHCDCQFSLQVTHFHWELSPLSRIYYFKNYTSQNKMYFSSHLPSIVGKLHHSVWDVDVEA